MPEGTSLGVECGTKGTVGGAKFPPMLSTKLLLASSLFSFCCSLRATAAMLMAMTKSTSAAAIAMNTSLNRKLCSFSVGNESAISGALSSGRFIAGEEYVLFKIAELVTSINSLPCSSEISLRSSNPMVPFMDASLPVDSSSRGSTLGPSETMIRVAILAAPFASSLMKYAPTKIGGPDCSHCVFLLLDLLILLTLFRVISVP